MKEVLNLPENTAEEKKKAGLTVVRLRGSRLRFFQHTRLFNQPPNTSKQLRLSAINNLKIQFLIQELAADYAVISPTAFHWTTTHNLRSIFKENHFFGNKALRNHNIRFTENSLKDQDIVKYGDGNTICFSPYLTCTSALAMGQYGRLRKDLVRLTLDLNKARTQGKYNQFFKIHDFGAPAFESEILINEELTIKFAKDEFKILTTFCFKNFKETIAIHQEESIFYGDLYNINLFCLLIFFSAIKKVKSEQFKKVFYEYLNSLSAPEVKKILVCFSQNMTITSEYNFLNALPLEDNLIQKIYFTKSQKLYDLRNQDREAWENLLGISHINLNNDNASTIPVSITDSILSLIKPVEDMYDFEEGHRPYILQNGYKIYFFCNVKFAPIKMDFRQIHPENFGQGKYNETRDHAKYNYSSENDNQKINTV